MNEAFNNIKRGLEEAIEHASGKKTAARVHYPEKINVKDIRNQIGMTQEEFSTTFKVSLGTLRHWERGDRQPQGPALILLHVIAKNPKAVLKALD